MITVFGLRHDQIGVARQADQVGHERRRYIRHVARNHERAAAGGCTQRRMNATERPGAGHQIGNRPGRRMGSVADNQNLADFRNACQHRDLTLENRPAADDQRALVAAAEALCAPTVQHRRCPHPALILLHAIGVSAALPEVTLNAGRPRL